MKRHATLIAILGLLVSLPAAAGSRDSDRDHRDRDRGREHTRWARVVRTTPIYERVRVVNPVRECWTERVAYERPQRGQHRRQHLRTPVLLGATFGGLLGSELGHDRHDRRVATLVGALIGGSVAHDIGHSSGRRHHRRHRNVVEYRNEQRCAMRDQVSWERQVVGYDVQYKHHGRIHHRRTGRDPGRRVKVAVDVRPARKKSGR